MTLHEHSVAVMAMPRILLACEAAMFAAASLVHSGVAVRGFEHARATIAEAVIAAVLAIGFMACVALPRQRQRIVALAAQAFALLGTLVGAFTIAVGIGPQTTVDRIFHGVLLLVLVAGLVIVFRGKAPTDSGAGP